MAGVTDQAGGAADLLHHRVTSIDAGGAIDAFHLCAVTDVDTRWTDCDALTAIYAITKSFGDAVGKSLVAVERSTLFAAAIVVSHDHAVLVEHGGLETAVWADESAGLL